MRFWIKTSAMAAGTGFIMGYFFSVVLPFLKPFFVASVGAGISMVINQWLVYRYIFGRMRGALEFVYKESGYDEGITSAIAGVRSSEETISSLEMESLILYRALIEKAKSQSTTEKFYSYLAAAKAANAGGEDKNTIEALTLACGLKPSDAVANFKLARAFERVGSPQEAIKAYEAAAEALHDNDNKIKGFILSQAQRVRKEGPQQRSPISGLIYQLM